MLGLPIQWVPGALSLGVKRPGRGADHSPPSSAKVKKCVELHSHSLNTPSWRGGQLKKESTGTTLPLTFAPSVGLNLLWIYTHLNSRVTEM
jgi:hypothetical protein